MLCKIVKLWKWLETISHVLFWCIEFCYNCSALVLMGFFFPVGRCITSLCWRPDGKAIAVGLDDGTLSLHDVEVGSGFFVQN